MHKLTILYKFTPFINNSFEETLKVFINYIVDKYNIVKVDYKDTQLTPDKCKQGGLNGNFKPLVEVFVKLSFTNDNIVLVSGYGHKHCTCYLDLDNKIDVHWETNYKGYEDAIKFTPLMCRKLKLNKLENNGK